MDHKRLYQKEKDYPIYDQKVTKSKRYDMDWAHRHFREEPIFVQHPNPQNRLKLDHKMSVKPSEEHKAYASRGLEAFRVANNGYFDSKVQNPTNTALGRSQPNIKKYTTEFHSLVSENLPDVPKNTKDFYKRYDDFTKNYEFELYQTKLGSGDGYYPHLSKYHGSYPDERHPEYYNSDFRYFPYMKNFYANTGIVKTREVGYDEALARLRSKEKLKDMYEFEIRDKMKKLARSGKLSNFNNVLLPEEITFQQYLVGFFGEVVDEVEILIAFQERLGASEEVDVDFVYDALVEHLSGYGEIGTLGRNNIARRRSMRWWDGSERRYLSRRGEGSEGLGSFENLTLDNFIAEILLPLVQPEKLEGVRKGREESDEDHGADLDYQKYKKERMEQEKEKEVGEQRIQMPKNNNQDELQTSEKPLIFDREVEIFLKYAHCFHLPKKGETEKADHRESHLNDKEQNSENDHKNEAQSRNRDYWKPAKLTRFQFKKFFLGPSTHSTTVAKPFDDNDNIDLNNIIPNSTSKTNRDPSEVYIEALRTLLLLHFKIIKRLKSTSRVFTGAFPRDFLKRIETVFPYQRDEARLFRREFHAVLFELGVKCSYNASCFFFMMIDIEQKRHIDAYDIFHMVMTFKDL